jgi:hypothetical protein
MIFMFVEENGEIKMAGAENDYLVCNVSYAGPHLPNPIRASARITMLEPVEFSYPLSPTGQLGQAKFSAFGVIGGKLRRSAEQNINFDEEAVFILASQSDIKLVSQASVMGESGDSLGRRLVEARARPQFFDGVPESVRAELDRKSETMRPTAPQDGNELRGTVIGVEYGRLGPSLLVQTLENAMRRVPLRDGELADRFDDERKRVRIHLDEQSFADEVTVEL